MVTELMHWGDFPILFEVRLPFFFGVQVPVPYTRAHAPSVKRVLIQQFATFLQYWRHAHALLW
jgi:hypothetical protein